MRLKHSVLLGLPPAESHNPEQAAEAGALADILVEGPSLAWILPPAVFPHLTQPGSVECNIEKRLFSLFESPGTSLLPTLSNSQSAEFVNLARRLMHQLAYGAAAAGVYDLDRSFFTTIHWLSGSLGPPLLKFLACGQNPVRTRLLTPLSPTKSLLDPPHSAAVRKACAADSECSLALAPVATMFERCEKYDLAGACALLIKAGLSATAGDTLEVTVPDGYDVERLIKLL